MGLRETLANLESTGHLHSHELDLAEVEQHVLVADEHLTDAQRTANSFATRFSIANTAGHALLMAAVKMHGYRPSTGKGHRSVLYQILDQLLPGAASEKETLLRSHNKRNKTEYDGDPADFTQGQVDDLIDAVKSVREEVRYLISAHKAKAKKPKP